MYQYQVSFGQAISMAFNKYCDFNGRASRSEYWWFTLFTSIIGVIAGYVSIVVDFPYLPSIISLAFFLPSLGLCVRRLHDIGKSAWWYLIAFIPLVGWILMIYWFVQPSQPVDNEYGPVPNMHY